MTDDQDHTEHGRDHVTEWLHLSGARKREHVKPSQPREACCNARKSSRSSPRTSEKVHVLVEDFNDNVLVKGLAVIIVEVARAIKAFKSEETNTAP